MSEAAGLVVGVVALASLFDTCIDLLNYFELGKNYLYDYELACTKVNLLHTRLRTWGCATRIQDPSCKHPSLSEPTKRDAVGTSLQQLRAILLNTEGLQKKYDLRPSSQALVDSKQLSRSDRFAHWSLQLRRRTTWSIRDRAKFDRFIDDISFLIDNLEKVNGNEKSDHMAPQPLLPPARETGPSADKSDITIDRLRVSQSQQTHITTPPTTPSAADTGQEETNPGIDNPDGAAGRNNGSSERASSATAEQIRANGVPTVDIKGLEQVNDSIPFAHLSVVDPEKGVWTLSDSKQVNSGTTTAFMGGASQTAMLKMQKAAYEYQMNLRK